MKSIPTAAVAIILAIWHTSSAQIINPGLLRFDLQEHRVTVQLAVTSEAFGSERQRGDTTTTTQRLVTSRVSNRSLLTMFQEQGIIGDIRGWSIVMLSYDSFPYGFALKKRGEMIRNVSDYFEIGYDGGTRMQSFRNTEIIGIDQVTSISQSNGLAPGFVNFTIGPRGTVYRCNGMMAIKQLDKTVRSLVIEGAQISENNIQSMSLNSGTGVVDEYEDENYFIDDPQVRIAVLTGRYNFAKGRLSDIPRMLPP